MATYQIKYYALIDIAKSRIKAANIREFVLTYAALCELALFAPLLPHYYQIRNSHITMKDINPIFRFMDASGSASSIEPIHNLSTDYTRFIEQICEKMRWPTPQQVAGTTLSNFTYAPLDRLSELYHRAQEFRMVMPWVFIDYSVWYLPKNEITAPFTYYFIHPIIELKDKTLFHKDKMLVSYFVLQCVVQEYLRKILLSKDISVMLPYRANSEEINFYREILETYLYTTMGIKNPPITLLAAT